MQVVDVDVTVEDYDTAIDYIVTPTRLIETRHEYPRPSKGIIWSRLAPGMREQIPPDSGALVQGALQVNIGKNQRGIDCHAGFSLFWRCVVLLK